MRGVRDRGPRNLPIFKAHPFVKATGQDGVEVYRYYRAAFRYCRRAYQKHARKSQSTQSVRFFGGISCGGMLGLLATWRCLLLDIVQTGVTSWLDSQSALWPSAVSLSLLAKARRSHTSCGPRVRRRLDRGVDLWPDSGPECIVPLARGSIGSVSQASHFCSPDAIVQSM